MAKAYWIANVDVSDAEAYARYRAANAAAFEKYGARFIVRGGAQQVREGAAYGRSVVIEFADMETAVACYESAEYAAAKAIREAASEGHLIIVEGYDA